MELVKKQCTPVLQNALKGLSSEFHPIRSKIKGTFHYETTNGNDPPASQTGPVSSITASLASLAPLW